MKARQGGHSPRGWTHVETRVGARNREPFPTGNVHTQNACCTVCCMSQHGQNTECRRLPACGVSQRRRSQTECSPQPIGGRLRGSLLRYKSASRPPGWTQAGERVVPPVSHSAQTRPPGGNGNGSMKMTLLPCLSGPAVRGPRMYCGWPPTRKTARQCLANDCTLTPLPPIPIVVLGQHSRIALFVLSLCSLLGARKRWTYQSWTLQRLAG